LVKTEHDHTKAEGNDGRTVTERRERRKRFEKVLYEKRKTTN
jgi:hypothetical protein